MVFQGGWRSRGRRNGPGQDPPGYGPGFDPRYDPGYNAGYGRRFGSGFSNRRQYGGGYGSGGSSCLRDMFLLEGGCCLAESLGCGPSLLLVAPAVGRRALHRHDVRPHTDADAGGHGRFVRAMLSSIELYQSDISPRRPARCRFEPSCSHYAAQALRAHGGRRGSLLAVRRLLRCRPGSTGGPDPVPDPTGV